MVALLERPHGATLADMKAGGRVLGFNIDPRFSNVLDVLMMADLRHAPQPILERYMGREDAAAFLAR